MRGPYSEYAAPPIYIYPDRPKPGIRFSRTEIRQLLVAILALSGAFTVLFVRYDFSYLQDPVILLFLFGVSLASVGTGVGLHEIMHKIVAQRYGLWAEFRYDLRGLLLAFVFAFVGFIFGAPGATWISGVVTREQNGRISAAGPATNMVLGAAFLGAWFALPVTSAATGLLSFALSEVAIVNLVLGGFNLVPILPLDGAKVWAWSKGVYLALVAIVAVLLVATFFPSALGL